tara:strand:- start:63 stop:566 length:504 start_codon:yes stop_codon:yes gene_type:complete
MGVIKNNFFLFILLISSSLNAQKEYARIISCDSIAYGIDTASTEKQSLYHLNDGIDFIWNIVNMDLNSDILKKDSISIQLMMFPTTNGKFNYIQFEEGGDIEFGNIEHSNGASYWNTYLSNHDRTYKIEGDILVIGYYKKHWWYKYKRKTKYAIIWNGNYCANLIKI